MGWGLLMGFRSWLVYSRLKLFQLLSYLRFDEIGRLLGILLPWMLVVSSERGKVHVIKPSSTVNVRAALRKQAS